MTVHFDISSDRIDAIAAAGNLTAELVREYCVADWPNANEHQEWLNAAPASEIADWVHSLARDAGRI